MLNISNRALGYLTVGAAIAAVGLLKAAPAQAQAAYGSYIGAGGALGLSNDDDGEGDGFGAVVAARYKLLELPISVRAQAFLFNGDVAVVPTVSYDYPISFQTDIYLGAGLSIPTGDDPSPVGDQTSFVIQPGVDFALPNSNLVIFGNAVFAFDAFEEGGGTATSIQGGVGYQF
ncbi:MAG: hypothetical protein AAGF01_08675 [Cyanobacteria bacterium P01_G01_bin.38]